MISEILPFADRATAAAFILSNPIVDLRGVSDERGSDADGAGFDMVTVFIGEVAASGLPRGIIKSELIDMFLSLRRRKSKSDAGYGSFASRLPR